MNNIFNISILGLLISFGTTICVCQPPRPWEKATKMEFRDSETVFIGDVTICDDKEYEIVVCEVFKGTIKNGQTIIGKNQGTCEPYIGKSGEWLLFGDFSTEFIVYECGTSSNINEPLNPYSLLPSDMRKERLASLNSEILEARKIVQNQIYLLRNVLKSQ